MTNTKPQIQQAPRTPSKKNNKNSAPRHFTFKLHKIKDKEKSVEKKKSST